MGNEASEPERRRSACAHVATHQHRRHRVTGFVHGDASTLFRVVPDILGQSDLGDQLSFDQIGGAQGLAAVAQRNDEGLVEQPLDADRAVTARAVGDGDGVDLRLVRLPLR